MVIGDEVVGSYRDMETWKKGKEIVNSGYEKGKRFPITIHKSRFMKHGIAEHGCFGWTFRDGILKVKE
ncbi:MAG: hypothetical protein D6679_00425 [Candidatus Hydrogenedentota bacterium]|nr:MAG: hypothetical protein D6679_00425 [Candidatus Hydrogenedentota bacterium]